jgi:protein-S-isoprenylcysteine O-methyltransferase Ste14
MPALAFLVVYIVFFAVFHSLTAAMFFKKWAYRFIEPRVYRFLYTAISVLTVLPILYIWFNGRVDFPLLYRIGFPYILVSLGMIIAGGVFILNSLILIDPLEFIGFKGVLKKSTTKGGLTTGGVYGLTRHPLYLGGMLILWANPEMRLIDLMVALLFSLYFVLGGILEERKLEAEFGEEYREYKKKVSMFLPVKWLLGFIRF